MLKIIRTLLVIAAMLTPALAANAQTQTTVTLKNGMTVTGVVKTFNPLTEMQIEIGGVVSTIPANEIAKVEQAPTAGSAPDVRTPASLQKEKTVNIAGVDVKFILVEGGTFKFGFDGHGSSSMDSEPVHDVTLSPFYITQDYVSQTLYAAVMGSCPYEGWDFYWLPKGDYGRKNKAVDNLKVSKDIMVCAPKTLNKKRPEPLAEDFIEKLREVCPDLQLGVPTEAQWFYAHYCNDKASRAMNKIGGESQTEEVVMEVSMNASKDPVGISYTNRGNGKYIPPSFGGRMPSDEDARRHSRIFSKRLTYISPSDKRLGEIEGAERKGGFWSCENKFRLVMPAE